MKTLCKIVPAFDTKALDELQAKVDKLHEQNMATQASYDLYLDARKQRLLVQAQCASIHPEITQKKSKSGSNANKDDEAGYITADEDFTKPTHKGVAQKEVIRTEVKAGSVIEDDWVAV
jgi:hypothetical protein